jgi:hypothetical protein
MLALLLLPSLLRQNTTTVVLENGRPIEKASAYWGTSDTFLDATSPMENNGDSHVLEGGPQRTILLKFGDLEMLGHKKVVKATLYLTPSVGGKPHLSSIRTVQSPWGEGPLRRPFFTDKPLIAPDWATTWKSRHSGVDGMDWQQNGATGPGDSVVIDGATMTDDGKEIAISGIEGAVQNMMDRWYQNNGFALLFSGSTEFFSSKNVTGKPRLVLELADEPAPTGPDLSVTLIEAKYDDAKANPPAVWPKDGSGVTYVAHVQNYGSAPAEGFQASWSVGEKIGSGFEVTKKLAPGEETTIELKRTYKANDEDHRVQPLGFLIKPKGKDAITGDDYLEIQEDAIPIKLPEVLVPYSPGERSAHPEIQTPQQEIRYLNDTLLARSRFSFAPDGAKERFRLAGTDTSKLAMNMATELQALGLIDYSRMNPKVDQLEGKPVTRLSMDRWPGFLGGGSTANDISVPGEIQLPYEANYNEIFDQYELQPTGLLAASDVAALNANLGKPISSLKTLGKLPGTIIVRAMNRDGDILPNTELRFYQSKDGAITTAEPTFRLVTGDGGSVILPVRVGGDGKRDQFGGLMADGSNGVYLVAATRNGVTDTAWIKAWQLCDSLSRTNKPAVFTELRFNVPFEEVDSSKNLAVGAKFTSEGGLDKLEGLADGSYNLPVKVGKWFEIDLGKDTAVTEIDVSGDFWKKFDILTYFTGEKVEQASAFAHEIDWDWNMQVRPEVEGGHSYLAYRGTGKSVRTIRFVRKDAGGEVGGPTEIRVFGAK